MKVHPPIEHQRSVSPVVERRGHVRSWLLVSLVGLAAQVAVTDYGTAGDAARVLWFFLGSGLLWLIYARRSRAARAVVVVGSLTGAVLYAFSAFHDVGHVVVALAFLVQALPLLTHAVRRHVTPTV